MHTYMYIRGLTSGLNTLELLIQSEVNCLLEITTHKLLYFTKQAQTPQDSSNATAELTEDSMLARDTAQYTLKHAQGYCKIDVTHMHGILYGLLHNGRTSSVLVSGMQLPRMADRVGALSLISSERERHVKLLMSSEVLGLSSRDSM